MHFGNEIKKYFGFLEDAGFKKRSYHISGTMCDESYVFKRRNVKIEIEFNSCADPYDINRFDPQNNWHINVYSDIDGGHENLAYSKLFSPDDLENLRNQVLSYEFKDVVRQIEIYSDFIKRNLERIVR